MGGCVCYTFDGKTMAYLLLVMHSNTLTPTGKFCIFYDYYGYGIVDTGVRLVREIPTDYVAFRGQRLASL
jgi:hypothetical protein